VAGKTVGYVRVSSVGQNEVRQLDGVVVDKVFTDRASGKTKDRPALAALLDFVREGDTVVVHSMDRMARNLDDLRSLVDQLTSSGVQIRFLKEGLSFSGDDSAMSTLLLSVMGAFAEFERALIAERQAEGIDKAKKRGVYRGRRPSLTGAQQAELVAAASDGVAKTVLAERFGVSRQTVYRVLAGSSVESVSRGEE